MSAFTDDRSDREHKLARMRLSLQSTFSRPKITIPDIVRRTSQSINIAMTSVEEQFREIDSKSNEPVGTKIEEIGAWVHERGAAWDALAMVLRKSRDHLRRAPKEEISRCDRKSAMKEIRNTDRHVGRQRAEHARNRKRLQYDMYAQPSDLKKGEAWFMAVTANRKPPAGAQYDMPELTKRSSSDQSSFRSRLTKEYCINGDDIVATPEHERTQTMWCPISGRAHDTRMMRAAHIVPWSLGEINTAYLFGLPPNEGFEALWSTRNGMMLHDSIEGKFGDGRLIIKEDPDDKTQLISFILDEQLLNDDLTCPATGLPYRTLHMRRLQFETAARPGRRNLYAHAVMTVLHRRRYAVDGWEGDEENVFNGNLWATPGPWLRRSMVLTLANEFGDNEQPNIPNLGDFPNAWPQVEEETQAMIMANNWYYREIDEHDDTPMED